ncbi:MAG: hypothetical protein ACK58T_31800, partial [Phycisphaerae bacterium]
MLLELLQSPQESLESIANEFKITLAALTIYLASDDAIDLFAQADLANARRTRTAANAQLDKCIGALSLMIDDFISDVTHNLQRETPKSRREQDRQKETTRRAATLLYRIANFTPKALTPVAPTPPAPSDIRSFTSPERERVGCLQTSAIPHPPSDISQLRAPNPELPAPSTYPPPGPVPSPSFSSPASSAASPGPNPPGLPTSPAPSSPAAIASKSASTAATTPTPSA